MPTPDRIPLDLDGGAPPTGRVSIEASAGTGKTYSLTQLVVLHVVHRGLRPDQLLLVTYTKAATAELRHKTREMCQKALTVLESGDRDSLPWLRAVLDDKDTTDTAKANLRLFLSRYDEAVISTIHGFCQRVLRQSGLAGSAPSGFRIVEDTSEIIDHVVSDHLAPMLEAQPDRFLHPSGADAKTSDVASTVRRIRAAVHTTLGNTGSIVLPLAPDVRREPDSESSDDDPDQTDVPTALAADIADTVRELVEKVRSWCAEHRIVTHDDLIRLVEEVVASQSGGQYTDASAKLAATIAAQHRLVMVDEFQDTDSAQWRIFQSIHRHGGHDHTLVTVGDPKQAIYRFRGADVSVYLDAESGAQHRYHLTKNWRSTAPLLEALDWLFNDTTGQNRGGFAFDPEERIRFGAVTPVRQGLVTIAAPGDAAPKVDVTDSPLEIRWVKRDVNLIGDKKPLKSKPGEPPSYPINAADEVLQLFCDDVADRVVELLTYGNIPNDKSTDTGATATRRVIPRDIAVLVNSHKNADAVVRALRDVHIPAVQVKTGPVFSSDAATHWRIFLAALSHPQHAGRVRARTLSVFGSFDEHDLAVADEDQINQEQKRCSADAELLRREGITALYLHYRTSPEFLARVLDDESGERMLTDLDHIAEALASHPALSHHCVAPEALAVLEQLIENSEDNDEQKRRIDTDEDAVTVMTMHSSKGLQFPIVILPTLHVPPNTTHDNPHVFTKIWNARPQRFVDAASRFSVKSDKSARGMIGAHEWIFTNPPDELSSLADASSRKRQNDEEEHSSLDRLLYVALTRAEYKVITYWTEAAGNRDKTWGRLLGWNAPKQSSKTTKGKDPKDVTPVDDNFVESTMSHHATAPGGVIATRQITTGHDRTRPGPWTDRGTTDDTGRSTIGHAQFDRRNPKSVLVEGYGRWSYSSLTRIVKGNQRTYDIGRPDDAPAKGGNDEPDLATSDSTTADMDIVRDEKDVRPEMPLAATRGGSALGNLVHQVFDEIDPSADDVNDTIRSLVSQKLAAWERPRRTGYVADDIARGIIAALDSPLGPAFRGETLRSLGRRNRLSELRFDYLLNQDVAFSLADVGRLLTNEPDLPPEIAGFGAVLSDRRWADSAVAGFMNGSIDAVFRVESNDDAKFFVTDYKSDVLHDRKDSTPLEAYNSARIGQKMPEKGYVVQALVYAVALHRFLRWRLGDSYDFDRHFGGVTYMFIRGMIGALDPQGHPYGIWHWQPPRSLVESLDALFATGIAPQGGR